jgi:hypothetical protein
MGVIEKLQMPVADTLGRANGEVVIGTIMSVGSDGSVLVNYPDNPAGVALQAICTTLVDATSVGRAVALLFANADPTQPIMLGLIRQPLASPGISAEIVNGAVTFRSENGLSFQCGASSLTMDSDGRVVLRGKYIASYADGTQRIRGATVEIN